MEEKLEQRCVALLREQKHTVCCAESCTGGLLAKRLTDVPGASAVFPGGVVSYCDQVKHQVLGVPLALLERHGAVSAPVAMAMAAGVRRLLRTGYALATTGVAGPDGDDRGNPVGRIFVALATPRGEVCLPLELGQQERDILRQLTADEALSLLLEQLTGQK